MTLPPCATAHPPFGMHPSRGQRHKTRLVALALALGAAISWGAGAEPPSGFDAIQSVPHGKVERLTYHSKTLGFDRPVTIYLPPGYQPRDKLPVLYLLHGAGDDEKAWNTKGAAANILDNLYADASAKVAPMIVVMPYGFAKRPGAPMPAEPQERRKLSRAFDDDFVADLIPFIEATYSTLADARHRAVAGLSMGGSQSLRDGLRHLDQFGSIGCFSSLLREPIPETLATIIDHADVTNSKLALFYLSTGDQDEDFAAIQRFHELLEKKGIKHRWAILSGAHTWKVWRANLYELATLLFHP